MIPGWSFGLSKAVGTIAEAFAHVAGKDIETAKKIGFAAGASIGGIASALTLDFVGGALVAADSHNKEQGWKKPKP